MLKRISFIFIKIFLLIIGILILIPYIICPVYDFPEPKQFSGEKLYNPYSFDVGAKWFKTNFHTHSKAWLGLTNGSKSPGAEIGETYRKLGYDITGISDYMKINKDLINYSGYIPVYEHGFGFAKVHHIIIGNDKVNWTEFFLFQSIHNKQFVINSLQNERNLIAIAHPGLRKAFTPEDFQKLTNYDCVEILRYDRTSTEFWDAALSVGRNVKLLADDDSHDINDGGEVGRAYTLINSKSLSLEDITNAIKSGNAIGVDLRLCRYDAFEEKIKNLRIPEIKSFAVEDKKFMLSFDSIATEIKFIGQNGISKKILSDVNSGYYEFTPDDTYIRTELTFNSGTRIYLNPVFRYSGTVEKNPSAYVNVSKSVLFYVFWVVALLTVGLMFKLRRARKRKQI